jgi:hypothetical protein
LFDRSEKGIEVYGQSPKHTACSAGKNRCQTELGLSKIPARMISRSLLSIADFSGEPGIG